MRSYSLLRIKAGLLIALGCSGPVSSLYGASKTQKVLYVDCTFTGPTAIWCENEALAWAKLENLKAQGVELRVHRGPVTNSTKKLDDFEKRLQKQDPTLEIFGIDVVWAGLLHKYLSDLEGAFITDLPKFHPSLIKANTINGRVLGIPMAIGNGLLFYRKDILEKYQQPIPSTWEALFKSTQLITKKEPQLSGYVFQGADYEGLTCNFLEWIASFGASQIVDDHGLILLNTAPIIRALDFFKKQFKDNQIASTSLNFHEKESYQYFSQGKAIFLRAWPSAWPILQAENSLVKDKIGVALLPRSGESPLPGHPSTLGGWSFAISEHSDQKELGVKLIRHLTSAAVQQGRAKLYGIVPTIPELFLDPEVILAAPYVGLHKIANDNSNVMLPIVRPAHLLRNSYPAISNVIWTEVRTFLKGNRTPQETATRLQDQVGKTAKRWRK